MSTVSAMNRAVLVLTLVVACGCAESRAPRTASGGRPGAPSALSVLHERDSQVSWDAASQISADLDQDGVADYALRGLRKDRVVVGIVEGPPAAKSRAWVLDFPWGKGTQDSLCSAQTKIELEDLDDSALAGAKAAPAKGPRTGKGISLSDDRCDAFHIYWSPEDQKFEWWRL
jgi:hypothetical protein